MSLVFVAAAFAAFASVALIGVAAPVALWRPAADVPRASYVAREKHDVVLMNGPSEMAGAVIATFLDDPSPVVDRLAKRLSANEGSWTVKSIADSTFQDIVKLNWPEPASETARKLDESYLQSGMETLAKEGIPLGPSEEIRMISGQFNFISSRNADSIYLVHVIDANGLFGRHGTVVIAYRRDQETAWGWTSPHDPFSFGRHRIDTRLVDRYLYEAISVPARIGFEPAHVGTFGQSDFFNYPNKWRAAMRSLPIR
jgi:hypothetical protein